MDKDTSSGLFVPNKPLHTGMIIIGLALFIVLGVRGISRIDDKSVAAGEHNKANSIELSEKMRLANIAASQISLTQESKSIPQKPTETSGSSISRSEEAQINLNNRADITSKNSLANYLNSKKLQKSSGVSI